MPATKDGTIKTQQEVATALGISDSEVSRLESKAFDKLHILTKTIENTHLVAHDPNIGEIDIMFNHLPWCQFIEIPTKKGNGSGTYCVRKIISRREWKKSFFKEELLDSTPTYIIT